MYLNLVDIRRKMLHIFAVKRSDFFVRGHRHDLHQPAECTFRNSMTAHQVPTHDTFHIISSSTISRQIPAPVQSLPTHIPCFPPTTGQVSRYLLHIYSPRDVASDTRKGMAVGV